MNLGDKALQVLKTVAPLVGGAIGGPVGAAAGTFLAKALGTTDEQATEQALLTASPDTLLKLKQANLDFKAHMAELGISEDKLVYDDIASARAREVAVKDSTPRQLAWVIIGGFMVVSLAQIIAMVGWAEQVAKIPPQGWLLIGNVSGYLANEAKQAAAYYFGSSAGSQAKDATLAEIAKQP